VNKKNAIPFIGNVVPEPGTKADERENQKDIKRPPEKKPRIKNKPEQQAASNRKQEKIIKQQPESAQKSKNRIKIIGRRIFRYVPICLPSKEYLKKNK
jgi:hypothetical protein